MLQEIDELFEQEIGAYVERLRAHNAAARSPPQLLSSDGADTPEGRAERQLAAVRRLAAALKSGVLERLFRNPDLWTSADCGSSACGDGGGDEAMTDAGEDEAAVATAAARCRALQAELEERRLEEQRLRGDVAKQLQQDSDGRVRATAGLLARLRVEAAEAAAAAADADRAAAAAEDGCAGKGGDGEGAAFRREFAEYARSIQANLESARDRADRLELRRRDLDAIGRQRRRGPGAAERLLELEDGDGRCHATPAADDERELVDAISRGEQLCRRMRRRAAEAGGVPTVSAPLALSLAPSAA